MAKVIYTPDQHKCYDELDWFNHLPLGSIVECSCGTRYVMREHQIDGPYWSKEITKAGKKTS